jgi:hypothetical protein
MRHITVLKNKREKTCILIDVAKPVDRNVVKNGRRATKIHDFIHRDTTNVKREIYDHISNNLNHWNGEQDG